jgi:hypothetical protein
MEESSNGAGFLTIQPRSQREYADQIILILRWHR